MQNVHPLGQAKKAPNPPYYSIHPLAPDLKLVCRNLVGPCGFHATPFPWLLVQLTRYTTSTVQEAA